MARLSFLTPIVFFCSVRSGSGKASMLAHLAVYLNSLGRKAAIIDLDRDTPLKIKNTIPESISITEYNDLTSLRETTDSRYQKSFYFTENDEIAYFPAQRIEDPDILFTDTTLRDFILQARSCYDLILINFPAGPEHCLNASDLLTRRHLWGNSLPVCLMISQAELRCLNLVDDLLKNSRAMSYQLRENIMLVFNKVPLTVEEQSLLSRQLNPAELRELYGFPYMQIIGNNEEYVQQKNVDKPIVLDNDSLMHQTIATLYRNLGKLGEEAPAESIDPDSFGACLDGALLEKLAPYLDSIHQAVASKLFIPAHQVQVFLEENASTYRIRVRVSDYESSVLGISSRIDSFKYSPPIERDFSLFNTVTLDAIPDRMRVAEKQILPKLTTNPIFRFDDSRLWSTKFGTLANLPLTPNQERYPSPIFFKPNLELPEIPSLSHLLGYLGRRKKYRLFSLIDRPHKNSNLTHFFIPPELSLAYDLAAYCQANYLVSLNLAEYGNISHTNPTPAHSTFDSSAKYSFDIPDIFARNHSLVFDDFTDIISGQTTPTLFEFSTRIFSCTNSIIDFYAIRFIASKQSSQPQIALVIPQSMPLYEPKLEEPAYESEKLEIKPDFEEQFTSMNHSFHISCSDHHFIESLNHFTVANLSMERPQFASASAINPVFPEALLSYSELVPDVSLRIFKPNSGPCPCAVDHYDRLQAEILPDRLKSHSTLLDQQLDFGPLKALVYKDQINKNPPQHNYTPDINTRFSVDYLSNQSLYEINSPPDKIKEFSFLFASKELKLPEKQLQIQKHPAFAFDVLAVWFKHKKDNSELCSNHDKLYSCNHITDSSASNRQFTLRIRDMLSIESSGRSRLQSILAQNEKKPGLQFIAPTLDIDFNRSTSQPALELSDKIELHKTDHSHSFDNLDISQPIPGFLLDQHNKDLTATLVPIDATIFVQPALSRNFAQPVFNTPAQQLNILESNMYLRQGARKGYISRPKSSRICQPSHTPFSIPLDMPFRSMRFALEPFENRKNDPQAITNIIKGNYHIRNLNGILEQSSGIVEHAAESFHTVKPLLEQQVLFNKLFDLGEQIAQRKATFRIHPPYPLDILFDHLVDSSRYHFRRLFDHPVLQDHDNAFNKEFTVCPNNQSRVSHYGFSHHVSPVVKRCLMPTQTKQFPIRNIKLRDLLKMARQASKQFSEVQGKITA